MKINVNRCYFHGIQPLINYKIKKTLCDYSKEELLDAIITRLDMMLDYGYLVPGNELESILPDEYKENAPISICGDDSVYLAQTLQTELPSVGGSYFDGEFSAYFHHIEYSPSLVFSEHVIENKKIEERYHSLSEEICIQDRIPLTEDLIAIQLPYETPLSKIQDFLFYSEQERLSLSDVFISISKSMTEDIRTNLDKQENIEKAYEDIQKFYNCLKKHHLDIPCINRNGNVFNKDKEYEYIEKNKEKILKLVKKVEEM